jgi:predicted 3-demethylubiquinone-9 3-methyltransferase (glyoxalase superfamily)
MQKITTYLTYNNQAEEAMNLYLSIFKNSKLIRSSRWGKNAPLPEGLLMSAVIEIEGQEFILLNGGPYFHFSEGISLFVNCETQEEINFLWEKLSKDGEEQMGGWLKDKFGVSWQIIPSRLENMINDPDPIKSSNVIQAMLQMKKMNIKALEEAYHS